ncbi:MAG TPA: Na+/H+ antiporter NhaA [Dehalococcoidia bacterium]|nr:Na+/H+ antiporter NhaA [Dehalococcoidia bacterium]
MANQPKRGAPLAATRAIAGALPRVAQPLQEFLSTEAAGGVLLLAAAAAGMLWANLPSGSYESAWGARVGSDVIGLHLDQTLRSWVNDGLMTLFFFVAGLEIKRELLHGELAGRRRATLPVAAALGGMAAPALIFAAFNAGGAGARGWGIPMATDIAFAVGVMALLGERVPSSLKVFLLALAIVDDLGAIAVIAVFYSDGVAYGWLLAAGAMFAATVALQRAGVRSVAVYVTVGVVAWLAMHQSGVHATIAGVAMGLLTPSRSEGAAPPGSAATVPARSPLDRLEHTLHPWSSFAVVPVFALANAGIAIDGGVLRGAAGSPITAGVVLGLVAGKPAGIMFFSWLAVRARLASLPEGVRWAQLAGVATVAGIGFTVSIFVTALAFPEAARADEARIGVLCGSALMAVAGLLLMRLTGSPGRDSELAPGG